MGRTGSARRPVAGDGSRRSRAVWMVLAYAAAAVAWIVVTDLLAVAYELSPFAQTLKGLLFVAGTSVALYLALAVHWRHVTEHQRLREVLDRSERLHSLGLLAAGVAHEFNNLLAVVLLACEDVGRELEARGELDADLRERLGAVQRATEVAADLTRRLLTFGRSAETQPAKVALDDLVRELAPLLERLLRRGVELRLAVTATPVLAVVDRRQVEQILFNLVDNAGDAIEEPYGTVTLGVDRVAADAAPPAVRGEATPGNGGWVRLRVRDDGRGMDEATLARALEPLFTTKPRGRGTGLGLPSVYGLTRQNGGGLHIESAPGRGTSVDVFFPLAEAPRAPKRSPAAPAAPPTAATVLVVLADPDLRAMVVDTLAVGGYQALEAATLDEAPAGVALDLVLRDVPLPSGWRARFAPGPTGQVRELAVASYLAGLPALLAAEEEGSGVIHRPFSRGELLVAVDRLLSS